MLLFLYIYHKIINLRHFSHSHIIVQITFTTKSQGVQRAETLIDQKKKKLISAKNYPGTSMFLKEKNFHQYFQFIYKECPVYPVNQQVKKKGTIVTQRMNEKCQVPAKLVTANMS